MSIFEAIVLGIVQGLTEFLPVSSSGHLEIGKVLLGVEVKDSLAFTVAVHGATVLSTLVVFRNDIADLFRGFFRFRMNPEMEFLIKIGISMVPVLIVGIFFKDQVESLFEGNLLVVGFMLLLTALLLALSWFYRRSTTRPIGYWDSLFIGIAQAIAVLPGLSRSGSTIATGLLLGNDKSEVARFSFLMVIIPIIGANLLDVMGGNFEANGNIGLSPILAGVIAAFVSGYLACRWMITLVKKGKLIWFAIYCALVAALAIVGAIL